MNILSRIVILTILTILLIPATQSVPGPGSNACEVNRHHVNAAIAGVIAGGDHEAQSNNPGCGIARSSTQVFQWSGQYSGPAVLAAATQTWTALSFTGCSLGAITQSNIANAGGTSNLAIAELSMLSNECRGRIRFTISVAATFTWEAIFHINIRVEQAPLSFLCDATGQTVNSYTPTQVCNPLMVDNSGSLEICPVQAPCFVETNSTVQILGNVSVNQTNLPPEPREGFDGSLYILVCIMIAVLVYLADSKGVKGNYAFAGFLSLIAGFIVFWERDRVGFNNVGDQGLLLAAIFMFLHLLGAAYLFYLFATGDKEDNTEKEDEQ